MFGFNAGIGLWLLPGGATISLLQRLPAARQWEALGKLGKTEALLQRLPATEGRLGNGQAFNARAVAWHPVRGRAHRLPISSGKPGAKFDRGGRLGYVRSL